MKWVTKVILAILILDMVLVLSESTGKFEILLSFFFFSAVILLPILALYYVLTCSKEELSLSIGSFVFGLLGGLVVETILFDIKIKWEPLAFSVSASEPPILGVLIAGNAPSLMILGSSLLLMIKYPRVFQDIKLRTLSIGSSLIGYVYGVSVGFVWSTWPRGVFMLFYAPLSFFYPQFIIAKESFLYNAGPLALVVTTFLVTYGISRDTKDILHRGLIALLILMFLVAAMNAPVFPNAFG